MILHKSFKVNVYARCLTIVCFFLFLIFNHKLFANDERSIIPGSSFKAYSYTLDNGFKLIVVPDYRNTLATVNFILDAGSNREQPGETGLAHFFEHMMFRKAKYEAEGNYDRVLRSIGGSGNAGTSESLVTYFSTFPAAALKTMLALESQRFLSLSLDEPYFSTEKGAVLSERKMRVENDPFQRGYEILRKNIERGTPQEWMVIGTKQDVQNLNMKSARLFYDRFYRPNNTLLVVGGPFKPEDVKKLVTQYFGKWSGVALKNDFEYPKDYLTRDIGKSFLCSENVTTKNINFVYPSYDSSLKSLVYSWLFTAMLNDNPEGSFEYRLQKLKLADQFNIEKVYTETKSNPFLVSFVLSSNQRIEEVKKFWDDAVKEILKRPLSKEMIHQVIKNQKVYNANVVEHLPSLTSLVTENAYFFKDVSAQESEMKLLQSVSSEDFALWSKEIFGNDRYYTVGIVPLKDAKNCSDL